MYFHVNVKHDRKVGTGINASPLLPPCVPYMFQTAVICVLLSLSLICYLLQSLFLSFVFKMLNMQELSYASAKQHMNGLLSLYGA